MEFRRTLRDEHDRRPVESWCEGWIDWNLWLDNLGGPNWVNNLCDAPILLDIFPEKIIQAVLLLLHRPHLQIRHSRRRPDPVDDRFLHRSSRSRSKTPTAPSSLVVMNATKRRRPRYNFAEGGIHRTMPPRAAALDSRPCS
ncbi:MAG: hypothetical protein MZU97_24640 [Bacillus subtilis]|nr:hypothetical protein [Bacillus subtilis]